MCCSTRRPGEVEAMCLLSIAFRFGHTPPDACRQVCIEVPSVIVGDDGKFLQGASADFTKPVILRLPSAVTSEAGILKDVASAAVLGVPKSV